MRVRRVRPMVARRVRVARRVATAARVADYLIGRWA